MCNTDKNESVSLGVCVTIYRVYILCRANKFNTGIISMLKMCISEPHIFKFKF